MALNKRDCIGLACWLLTGILISLLALPIMVGRKIYQLSTITSHVLNGKM